MLVGENMAKKKLILDFDPGLDDISASLMLFNNCDKVSVELLTVSGGNVDIKYSLNNALLLAEKFCPYQVEVAAGANSPLDGTERINAGDVHGETGIGSTLKIKKPKKKALTIAADEALFEKLNLSKQKLCILAIGPLTNVALLLRKHPEIRKKIGAIVCMGGAIDGEGNYTPYAEYNFLWDANAAKEVIESGVKFILCPIEIAHRTPITKRELSRFYTSDERGKLLKAMFENASDPNIRFGFAFHDSCAAAFVIKPSLFTCQKCNIEIVVNKKKKEHAQTFCHYNKKGKNYVIYPKNNGKLKKFILENTFKG